MTENEVREAAEWLNNPEADVQNTEPDTGNVPPVQLPVPVTQVQTKG